MMSKLPHFLIRLTTVFFVVGLLVLGGCDKGPKMVPVSGIVTLNGKPLVGAGILFQPVSTELSNPATGDTDSEGRYHLRVRDKKGAFVGAYKVCISKVEWREGSPKPIWHSPEKYSKPDESGLTADVTGDDKDINFDLKGK
jgi:hypothetical protein